MILRSVACLLLVLASFGAVPASSVSAQEPGIEVVEVQEEASNLPAFMIGAVLLGAGVWAYMNKKKRFPGARFRD